MKLAARIGVLEIGEKEVRLAVVRTGGKVPMLCETHIVSLAEGEWLSEERRQKVASAVGDLVKKVRHKSHVYLLCADARFAVTRTLTVPFRGKSKVAAAVRFELEPYLAFPIEEIVTDHNVIREVEGETEVLVVGMRKDLLEPTLQLCAENGVDVEAIGIDAAGLTALWRCGEKSGKGLNALLHVRENGCFLVIVQDQTLCFMRYIGISADNLQRDPHLAARDVANTLRSFLASWKTAPAIDAFFVTGFQFESDEAREIFEGYMPAPVSYVDLMNNVRVLKQGSKGGAMLPEGDAGGHLNAWTALIGVAVGAAGVAPFFNFRQGDLARPDAWRHILVQSVFTGVLAAVLLLSFGLFCYVDYRRNTAEIERAGAEIWDLFTKTFPNVEAARKRPTQDVGGVLTFKMMDDEFKKSGGTGRGFSPDLLTRPTLLDILGEITGTLSPEKVLLTDIIVRSSNSRSQPVTIMGELKDPAAIAQEFEKLRQSKLLNVTGEPTVSSKPDKTTFTIVASTQ